MPDSGSTRCRVLRREALELSEEPVVEVGERGGECSGHMEVSGDALCVVREGGGGGGEFRELGGRKDGGGKRGVRGPKGLGCAAWEADVPGVERTRR